MKENNFFFNGIKPVYFTDSPCTTNLKVDIIRGEFRCSWSWH